jgi:hypothetical protein
MTPEETAEIIRRNKEGLNKENLSTGSTEPYQIGEKNIPESIFDRRRVPKCLFCQVEQVDFWTYDGSVDLEKFCTDQCEAKWERRRERMRQQQAEDAQAAREGKLNAN